MSPVRLLCLGLLVAATTGCSPDAATPTTPSGPATPGSGSGPGAQLTVVVDSLRSEEAIAGLSEVSFDVTGSTGVGILTYRIDFGDASAATTPTARHVYAESGTYMVTATVTDSTGLTTAVSRSVVVRAVTGAWLHAAYSVGSREVLVRRLSLTSQTGTTVRGFVGLPNQPDRPVSGELVPPRTLRLTFDDPAFGRLEGVLPGVLGPATVLELGATGGPAHGERLVFRPMAQGEPTGSPPDAVLNHRYFSFSARFAIRGFSPMRFDGSGSRGDGLSYFIEFGDGQFSTEAVAVHPIEEGGKYTARLTVVDRFGRADAETREVLVDSLIDTIVRNEFWQGSGWISSSCTLQFDTQRGANVGGEMRCPLYGPMQRFSGTLSGERDIRLVTDSGEVLTGTLDMGQHLHYEAGKAGAWRMDLVQTTGANSGQTLSFVWRCCYT